jgi:polyhydroxyalkanoate synthesis repressor PhaR
MAVRVIKKYPNRRLYDTETSRYLTMSELADLIRDGTDVKVVDARENQDLTQQTLAQIILESRGAARLLPVPLLVQLIRLNDEALSDFLGRWVSGALEMYLKAREGAKKLAPWNPFASLPFDAASAFADMVKEFEELKRVMLRRNKKS